MKKSLFVFAVAVLALALTAPVFAQSGVLSVLCTPQELWCQGMEEALKRNILKSMYNGFAYHQAKA